MLIVVILGVFGLMRLAWLMETFFEVFLLVNA